MMRAETDSFRSVIQACDTTKGRTGPERREAIVNKATSPFSDENRRAADARADQVDLALGRKSVDELSGAQE